MKCQPFVSADRRLVFAALVIALVRWGAGAASSDDNWEPAIGIPGTDGPVRTLLVVGDTVYAAGRFSQMGVVAANSIAKFDTNGWAALGNGVTVGILPSVFALAYFDGQIYAGGVFGRAGTIAVNNIARWDGTNWFSCGQGVGGPGNGIVRAMAIAGDKLIVGGTFDVAGGMPAANIAQWDGTNWSPLSSGITWTYPSPAVDSLASAGSDVYAGGRFRTAGGIAATNVAKWNGSYWLALGNGLRHSDGPDWTGNGIVRAMLASRNSVFGAGELTKAGDATVSNIARWDGTNWSAVGAGVGAVYTLAANGTDIFAGGFFSGYNHIAKWNGHSWTELGSGIGGGLEGGAIWSLASSGSELYAGGPFGLAGGKPANNIALWHIPHPLNIQRTGNEVALSWPATGTNFVLESCGALGSSNWSSLAQTPAIVNNQCVVTNALGPSNQFFRLRRR